MNNNSIPHSYFCIFHVLSVNPLIGLLPLAPLLFFNIKFEFLNYKALKIPSSKEAKVLLLIVTLFFSNEKIMD